MQEGVCLDGCVFVLMLGRVEDEQGSERTSELEGRIGAMHTSSYQTFLQVRFVCFFASTIFM